MEEKIAVIDCDSVAYSMGNPNKVLDKDGRPLRVDGKGDNKVFVYVDKTEDELKKSVDVVFNSILNVGKFTHYIGFIKGKRTTNFRKEVNPLYKANRSGIPPTWWKSVKGYLMEKYGIIEANNYESDDYVNVTRLQLENSYLVAIDQDLLSLEGTHYNFREEKWRSVDEKSAAEYFWKDVITGQKGDNVKGIPGIGVSNKIFKDKLFKPNINYVLGLYILKFGEIEGVEEFYKSYKSLKILEEIEGFEIPEPKEYKNIFM